MITSFEFLICYRFNNLNLFSLLQTIQL